MLALNERLCELLNHCVEEYIKTAAPISSATMAQKDSNHLSSATIRNDLKMLEQLGFLHQLHASGGRVPTTLGYHAYVTQEQSNTFAGDLINDLAELTRMAERIAKKIQGSTAYPILAFNESQALERRKNIYRLLEVPNLDMSALYLLIKEKADVKKQQ